MGVAHDKALGLTDHTIDTDEGIVAGWVLKSSGAVVGYLWCGGSTWKWRSADGTAFGERQTKKAAIETLHDVRAAQTGQARSTRPPLPAPSTRIIAARPTASFEQSREPWSQNVTHEPPTPKRQVVWGDNASDGADLTAAIGAALNKHKGGSQ